MTFERSATGDITRCEPWQPHVCITTQLIDVALPEFLTVGEGVVELHASGETALYRVDETGPRYWACSLLSVEENVQVAK